MQKILKESLKKLRETKPLVLCLTNYVTMDFMANSLLALGAAPIMSCDDRELYPFKLSLRHSGHENYHLSDPSVNPLFQEAS